MAEEIEKGGETKTFTQEEVDAIIGKRLAKAMRGMPNDDELKEFKAWKDSKESDADKLNTAINNAKELQEKLDAANAKNEKMEREKFLADKGVPSEDIDYYEYKIGKMVDDKTTFEKAAEAFLKEHTPHRTRVELGANVGGANGGGATPNSFMNDLLRGARK